jgi:MarR family transcriptional regulator, organic hydroperoxide resistance regulator
MTPDNAIPIEDYICLALYRASRAVTGLYRELLADLDLTYPQYLVMRLLWQRGNLAVREIGEALGLDYGTLSPLLKRLEAAGLIERRRRRDDERSVDITLTPAGRALEAPSLDVPEKLNCALGLNDADARALKETLARLTISVEAPATT